MFSYKLNNSYTVYVNYAYLNDCIKASKKKQKTATSGKTYMTPAKKQSSVVTPLAANTLLWHKTFGYGKVLSTDKNGIMSVAFEARVAKFVYPDVIKQGFLALAH